ncbi:MAG: hypothetical protein HQ495_10590 [Alphaproteobacteria bacterium]|nr:hypothetical protein [Alphaproteobacteria bacterium]
MPIVMVKGRDGDRLEVNQRPNGALTPTLTPVPVDEGWSTFTAIDASGAIWHEESHDLGPADTIEIDLRTPDGNGS